MDKYNFINIFKSTKFGVEFESCNDISVRLPNSAGVDANNRKHASMVNLYNGLIENSRVPSMYDENLNPIKVLTFSKNVGYHPHDSGLLWTLQVDTSIVCEKRSYVAAEIVTPIMYMGDDNYNSEYNKCSCSKNELWKNLEKDFKQEGCYFEGLFIMLSWYNLMFNNMELIEEVPHIHQYNTDKNGLHVHISNPSIKNNKKGILYLTHFLRTFYFFENLIGHFLTENRRNNIYCVKMRKLFLKKGREEIKELKIKENILSALKQVYFEENKLVKYLDIHEEFNLGNERYVTVNLANNINGTKGNFKVADNLRMEIRYHQSTDYIEHVYNWILFLNMMLSTCISEMSEVCDLISTDLNKASELYDKYNTSFMDIRLSVNEHVNINMFNLLFSRFCPNEQLKNFYFSYCDVDSIINSTNVVSITNSLILHPKSYFDENGELVEDHPMTVYQRNIDYNFANKVSNRKPIYKKKYFKYDSKIKYLGQKYNM